MLRLRPADAEDEPRHERHLSPAGRPATRRVVLRVLAPLLALALVPAEARAQDDFTTQLKTVSSIRFAGRHKVPAARLRQALRTRPPSFWPWAERTTYRPDFLPSDSAAVVSVYRDHGYLDARVDRIEVQAPPKSRSVRIVIHVHEGQLSRIRTVTFEGVERTPTDGIRKALHSRPGKTFNPSFLVVDTALVARVCRDHGFNPHVGAWWRRARPDSLSISVHFVVEEGPLYHVGQTYVSTPGELKVKENLIRRELLLDPGKVFRISKVEESQERLYETGLFSQVQVTPLPDSTNRTMEFDLRVRPRSSRWLETGAGSGTSERFRVLGQWGHRNLYGRGLQDVFSGQLALDGKGRYLRTRGEVSLLEPWAFRTRTRAQVAIYGEDGRDKTDTAWVRSYQARGVSLQLRRNLARRTRLYLIQDNTFVHQTFEFRDTISQVVLDSLSREVPRDYRTHRITMGFDRDVRDNPVSPALGSTQEAAATLAGGPLHGGSYLFDRFQGTATWYRPVTGKHWTLALRGRAGIIQPFGDSPSFTPDLAVDADVQRVPRDERFRLGGVNSIRGYNENDLPPSGGLLMLLGNLELRIPLLGPLGIEAYVDAGNVWARPAYVHWDDFSPRRSREPLDGGDVRYVVGVGPRLELPFGPLRVDFSWSLRPEITSSGQRQWRVAEPQFAIGPSF